MTGQWVLVGNFPGNTDCTTEVISSLLIHSNSSQGLFARRFRIQPTGCFNTSGMRVAIYGVPESENVQQKQNKKGKKLFEEIDCLDSFDENESNDVVDKSNYCSKGKNEEVECIEYSIRPLNTKNKCISSNHGYYHDSWDYKNQKVERRRQLRNAIKEDNFLRMMTINCLY
jgi:hypothetical protein